MLEPNAHVRLVKPFGELEAGAVGRLVGYYAYEKRKYLVDFGNGVELEVPPEFVVGVDECAEN